MATATDLRRAALALANTEEKSHFGKPDFRVRGKIFAGLSAAEDEGTLKLAPDAQAMLLDARPQAFFPAAGAWGRHGWTHVRLAHVDRAELAALVEQAWQWVAPPPTKKQAKKQPRARPPKGRKPR